MDPAPLKDYELQRLARIAMNNKRIRDMAFAKRFPHSNEQCTGNFMNRTRSFKICCIADI